MNRKVLFFALASVACMAAQAVTYDTTQTVTEPLPTTETTINVKEGAVVTFAPSATISGSKPITKTGKGDLLICSANGGFSGGFTVEQGYLIASNSTAFGTADVTVLGQRDGYKGKCAVGFWGVGGKYGDKTDLSPIYYANNIKVTGNSTGDYPALIGYGRAAQLTGTITAEKDFYFIDDQLSIYAITASYYSSHEKVTNLVFNSSVTVNGIMAHDGWSAYIFKGKVKAKAFNGKRWRSSSVGNQNADYHFYDTCSFNAFTNTRHTLHFRTADVLKGASLMWEGIPGYGDIYPYGNSQSVGELASMTGSIVTNTSWRYGVGSSVASTLTITGFGTGKREAITQMTVMNALSLVINARDDFTQTFYAHPDSVKRYNTMSGSITVSKGTLKFSGITRFANASALTVKAGAKFLNESTDPDSLMALKDMTVEDGATVVFATPTKFTLNSCTFGDQRLPPGIGYTHENFPVIPENLTIDVVGGMPEAKTLAVWTGAAGDGKMSNLENWRVDGVIPSELDLTSGTTAVRIDGGTEMIPDFEGVRVHSIVNNRTAGADVPLFYVGAKGKTLMVDGQIVSNAKAWWAFRGTIAPPNGIAQSGNSRNGPYCVTHINGGERNTDFQCIFFAGVTMKKPIWMYTNYTGGHPFVGAAGTYNLIEADVTSDGGGNNMPDVRRQGTVEFTGGYVQGKRPMLVGGGELRFSGKPVNNSVGYGVEVGSLVVASTGNQFRAYGESSAGDIGKLNRGIRVYGSALLKFECGDALVDNDQEQLQLTGSNEIHVDFGCYTQRFSRVYGANTGKLSYMTGEYPAMLEVKGGTKWTSSAYFIGLTNRVQITGGIGFHYLGNGPASPKAGVPAGADDVFVLMGQDFQTTGNLEVSGGTVELADGATWRNASNFVVRCGRDDVISRLKFASEDQVNRRTAEIFLEGAGASIYIPTGVKLRVHRVFVDGEDVGHGTFYSDEPSGVMAKRITGGGTLYVHGEFRGSIIRFE